MNFLWGLWSSGKEFLGIFLGRAGSDQGPMERSLVFGGDFNEILFPNERLRGGRLSSTMRCFSKILNELGLRDLPLQGGPFYLEGGCDGRLMSRLDRFLVSDDWESQFGNAIQRILPRPVSNHSPILLDNKGVRSGPSPFCFELMWLKFEGFKDF